ncbi:MAG: hypothetical protein ISS76_15555 [Phycisphaerae bacterium]|nr:hypothetical protein [Phycisphaerae bacterium]
MKKNCIILLAFIILILIFPFIFSFIHPWTNIQCRKEYIDINTGISRTQKYYWFLKYSDKTEPTYLSKLHGIASTENPQWHIVNTLSFGHGHSPHYIFHSAFGQIKNLKLLISLYNIKEKDSKAIARQIIELWKENRSDDKAGEYLHEINMQYGKDFKY